jgi:drug/metabolite transporter (DMT)-like permease
VVARCVAIALFATWFILARRPLLPPRGARLASFGAGALDSAANVAYWVAVQGAPIALIATLVSLAPATTVLLARVVFKERWTVPQRAGFALAMVAGGLISLG